VDLDTQLCVYIRNLGGAAANCGLGVVPANGKLSLQMDPGSKAIQTYFNGNQDMAVNFELALNSDSYETARATLNPIADALTNLKEDGVLSVDGSFEFDHIEITSTPFNQLTDNTGNIYWVATFTAFVTKFNNK
jgi:hypothetical protein